MDPVSHVLTCVPVVYHRVFDCLPLVDLYRAKMVCRAWKECAEYKIGIREQCYKAQVLTFAKKKHQDSFVSFNRTGGIASWKKDSESFRKMQEWRSAWSWIPYSGICMSFWQKGSKNCFVDAENMIRHWLPDNSKLLVLPCLEYTICVDNKSTVYEMIEGLDFVQNFISFPPNSNRHSVEFLHLGKFNVEGDMKQFQDNVMKEVNDPNTKLILLCVDFELADGVMYSFIEDIISPVVAGNDVVLLGGLFDKPIIYNPKLPYAKRGEANASEAVALSFKGENVRATSLLLDQFVQSTASYMEELEKLKDTVTDFCKACPEKCARRKVHGFCESCSSQMFAIMVACVARCDARGQYYDQDNEVMRNYETSMFRSMIPNVPIIGTYGMGEIGFSKNLIDQVEFYDDDDQLIRNECTIFAVLRFQ